MNIVILSRNKNLYSTRRLVEEAENRGHIVEVIDPLNCDLIIEKERPTIYYKDKYLDYVDAIIPRIGASVTFYGCAVVRQFEMMNIFSTVSSDAIIRSRDKLRSFQHLSKGGIDMPKTVFTNYSKDVEEVIEHVGGTPVVIKLLEGTQGLGVVLAESKNAAESVLEAFNGLEARALVQEYISEAKGVDIRAFIAKYMGNTLTDDDDNAVIRENFNNPRWEEHNSMLFLQQDDVPYLLSLKEAIGDKFKLILTEPSDEEQNNLDEIGINWRTDD